MILTRDDDRALGLDERAAVANNGKANLLISLHINGSRVPNQSGAEVFHLQLDRESAEVVRGATAEGAALPTLGGGIRRLDLIPWDLAQARHLDESAATGANQRTPDPSGSDASARRRKHARGSRGSRVPH